jgi:hypothetical protein
MNFCLNMKFLDQRIKFFSLFCLNFIYSNNFVLYHIKKGLFTRSIFEGRF